MSEHANAADQTPNPNPNREHPNAGQAPGGQPNQNGAESWHGAGAGPAGYAQAAPPPAQGFYPPPYPYPYPPPGYYPPPPAAPYWSGPQPEAAGYGYAHGEPHGPTAAMGSGASVGGHAGAGYGAGHGARVSDLVNEVASGGSGLSSLTRMLDLDDLDFWKGALVGAAAVMLLTNRSVQTAVFGAKVERTDDA